MTIEIQLYKALTAAGIPEQTALDLTNALDQEIKERFKDSRTELATKADIERLRTEIAPLKWGIGLAVTGIMAIVMKTFF
jgi:hypothetical protein